MVVVLIVLPLVLLSVVAVVALVSVRQSSLRITTDGVRIHNFGQPATVVPLDRVEHFEAVVPVGNLTSLRPRTAVLVLTDGSRLSVRSMSDTDAGHGIEALNARMDTLRRQP